MARPAGQLLLLMLGTAALWTGATGTGSGSASGSTPPGSPAELVIVPANTTATEGNTLILVCVAYGDPTPDISWLKDGTVLANDSSRITVLTEVVMEQGIPFVQSTLRDMRSRQRVEIVVQPDNGTFTEGNTGIFTCVASGEPSTPSIAWWMNEMELYNSSAEGRVKIYQETVEVKGATFVVSYLEICGITMDDAGVYSCSAYLPSANVTSGEFRVSVTSALPEIVIAPANTEVAAGNTAIFTCVGLSEPPPNITWTFEGEAIANDSRTSVYSLELEENGVVFTVSLLELCGVDLEESGTYSCVATGGMANTTAYFQLNVLEQNAPDIVIAPQNTTLDVNNTALFTCVALAGSAPSETTISWMKGGTNLYNDSRVTVYTTAINEGGAVFIHSILEICGVTLEDSDYYTCVAGNAFGIDYSNFTVEVVDTGPPDIVIAPSNTDVLLGNTVLLTCVVAFLNTPPELSWHRNDTGELYNTSDVSIYTSTIEEGGVMFLRSILELCGVELSDEGLYFCQAAFDMNPDRTSRAYFYVDVFEENVEIIVAPADSAARANSTILFTCVAYGVPLPSYITWTFNGTALSNSSSADYSLSIYHSQFQVGGAVFLQSILEICGLVEEQSGYYSCSAESSAGNDTETFRLIVQPLAGPAIAIAPNDTEADINSTVIFRLRRLRQPPAPTSPGFSGLCGVTVENQGLYSCVAENSINITQSYFYLNILEPPTVAIQPDDTVANYGDTVLLTCVVYSVDPRPYVPPNVLWYRDEELIANSTDAGSDGGDYDAFTRSILELCGVTLAETGEYSCVANDSIGMSPPATFNVSVFTSVTIVIAPSDEVVSAGVTSLFTCVATGIPDPAFSWLLENTAIAEGDRHNITTVTEVIEGVTFVTSVLQICEINFSDEGTYRCVADVPGLSDSASFEISIQDVGATIEVPPMNVTVVRGTEVTLVCGAMGAPLPL
ncbi:Hemicentin-1 [Geodia barretti]|uniref:Hemicentin-1 n=1 Tax=Geodia barretti TaxID=519541 RepID=A0AA35X3Q1_GEOBA|nr:Hemicentin-1 [Geodia barretti]